MLQLFPVKRFERERERERERDLYYVSCYVFFFFVKEGKCFLRIRKGKHFPAIKV
jgi:hypothetical protein